MSNRQVLIALLLCALLSRLGTAEGNAQSSNEAVPVVRALVLKRSDIEMFSPEDRNLIIENQKAYLKAIVDKFHSAFDPVLTMNAGEYSELWDRYLETMKRNDLVDGRFKGLLSDALVTVLTSNPKMAIEFPVPITFANNQLKKAVSRRLSVSEGSDLTKEQLDMWKALDHNTLNDSLKTVNAELEAIEKVRQGTYLSARGDHIRSIYFALSRYLTQQKMKNEKSDAKALANRFFSNAAFMKWTTKRESKFLNSLFQLRLRDLGTAEAAVRNLEDLVAKVENSDRFKQLLEKLEAEAQGNTNSHLERFLELLGNESEVEPHRVKFLKTYFKHFREQHPLDPKTVVKQLRNVYYPEYIKSQHLLNSCKLFANSLALALGPSLKPPTKLYADELIHLGLIEPHDADFLHRNIDHLIRLSRPRKLQKISPEEIKKIMKSFNMAEPKAVPLSPYSPEFRNAFAGTQKYKTDFTNTNGAKFKTTITNGETIVFGFGFDPAKGPYNNIWKHVDTLTPKFMSFVENNVGINKDYGKVGRHVPKAFWTKLWNIPAIVQPSPFRAHIEVMTRLIAPKKTITGLNRLRHILGRYVQPFGFPPAERKYWMKFMLKMLIKSYKDRRKVNLCLTLSKLRDRIPDKPIQKIQKVTFGTLIQPRNPPFLLNHKTSSVLGRLRDIEPLKSIFRVKTSHITTLAQLIKRKRRESKISLLLQKLIDKKPPTSAVVTRIASTFISAFNKISKSESLKKIFVGRGRDFVLPQSDQKYVMNSMLELIRLIRTRYQKKLQFYLQKIVDRPVKPAKTILSIKSILQAGAEDLKQSRNWRYKTIVMLGKSIDIPMKPTSFAPNLRSFIVLLPGARKRLESAIQLSLQRYADRPQPLAKVYNSVLSNLNTIVAPGGFKNQNKQILVLSRSHDNIIYPLPRLSDLRFVIDANFHVKLRKSKTYQIALKRLRDRIFKSANVSLQAIQALIMNKQKTIQKVQSNNKFMERIRDKEILNPRYALAIVGCFEHFFSDIKFTSWTELHSAMREYLEAVRDLDSANTSFEFIRQALLHLQPFYAKGNLNYERFFNNFRGDVRVELPADYESQTIIQMLGKKVLDCQTSVKIFAQLLKLAHTMYPSQIAKNVGKVLRKVINAASECQSNFHVSDIFENEEAASRTNDQNAIVYADFKRFLGVSVNSILRIKSLVNKGIRVFTHDLSSVAFFFEQNRELLLSVYGEELLENVAFVLGLLRQVSFSQHISMHDVFVLSEEDVEALIAKTFAEYNELLEKIITGFQMIRVIFLKLGKHSLSLLPFTHYEFSGEVKAKMGFCNRYGSKIGILTSKIREKKSWRTRQIAILGNALQSVAKEGSFSTHRFTGLEARTFDHVLRPFLLKTMMAAYVRHFGDMNFRDYKKHFKSFFIRFVDTFNKSKILTKTEAQALTKLLGDRQFYRDHQYHFKDVIIRYCSVDLQKNNRFRIGAVDVRSDQNKLKKQSNRHKTKGLIGKIRDHGLYKMLEIAKLRKNLLDLFQGKGAVMKVANLVSRLQRLRLKYHDKSVSNFLVAKHVLGMEMVYDRSKRARIFYRTFNKLISMEDKNRMVFKNDIVRLVQTVLKKKPSKLSIRRTIYKGITQQLNKAIKWYADHVAVAETDSRQSLNSLRKILHKTLQDAIVNKLNLNSLSRAGYGNMRLGHRRSFRRRNFKHFLDQKNIKQELNYLRNAGSRSNYKGVAKSIKKQRFKSNLGDSMKKLEYRGWNSATNVAKRHSVKSSRRRKFKFILTGLQKALHLKTGANKAAKEQKIVKAITFRKKMLKYFEAPNLMKMKFLEHVLAPEMAEQLRRSAFAKRFFLKQIDSSKPLALRYQQFVKDKIASESIFVRQGVLAKRYRIKQSDLFDQENLYLKFLKSNYRAPVSALLKKVLLQKSQRMRLNELDKGLNRLMVRRNKAGSKAFSALSESLRDFQRSFISRKKEGKRLTEKVGELNFIMILKRLIKRLRKQSEIGKIRLPDTEKKPKIETAKIFCCGCSCVTCLTDEMCLTGAGLEECLEHQKRVNSDTKFITKAASMVNVNPVVNFFLNVKNGKGGYEEMRVLRFGNVDPNLQIVEELRLAERRLSGK